MAENLDILNTAVSLLIRAALLAARFSGRVRQRYLKRLAGRNLDARVKEILFLKDRIYQLEMQISILQKHFHKKGKKPRYSVREPETLKRDAKTVPDNIERHVFAEPRLTAYRLKNAA